VCTLSYKDIDWEELPDGGDVRIVEGQHTSGGNYSTDNDTKNHGFRISLGYLGIARITMERRLCPAGQYEDKPVQWHCRPGCHYLAQKTTNDRVSDDLTPACPQALDCWDYDERSADANKVRD